MNFFKDHLPITVRQIYYRLIATEKLPDKSAKAAKNLNELVTKMRRARILPFDCIRDDKAAEITAPGWLSEANLRSSVRYAVKTATINPAVFQPIRQLVICEAAGMLPQDHRVAGPFGAPVLSSGGFQSVAAKHELASRIASEDRPHIVWHIGDYDPSGVHVFQSLAEDVEAFAGELGASEISFQRLCITPEQIERFGLPMAPAKTTDARAFDGSGTVQAEALEPTLPKS